MNSVVTASPGSSLSTMSFPASHRASLFPALSSAVIDSASHWALQTEKQGGRRATLLGYPAESFPMVNPYTRQNGETLTFEAR